MRSIVTSNYHGLILFVWIASVLTSSTNNENRTDGTLVTGVSNAKSSNSSSDSDRGSLVLSGVRPASATVNSVNALTKNVNNTSIMGEGGPISTILSTVHTSPAVSQVTSISKNLSTEESVSKEKSKDLSTGTEKGTQSKIFPRKGATEPDPVSEKANSMSNKASNDAKSVVEVSSTTQTVHITEQHINVQTPNDASNTNTNVSLHDTNKSQTKSLNSTTVKPSPTPKKHKPKPTVTIGEPGEPDKPIPASPTKSPPLGMPRKIDYIIPVVITIIAVPLLGTATFILYRRGRDCWDKRHYRRMDFLIDGMYND